MQGLDHTGWTTPPLCQSSDPLLYPFFKADLDALKIKGLGLHGKIFLRWLKYGMNPCNIEVFVYIFTVTRRIGGLESDVPLFAARDQVTRRIGGLENHAGSDSYRVLVTRRIGGLEKLVAFHLRIFDVTRRIGGLESSWESDRRHIRVTRRIGGLEIDNL